MKIFVRSKIAIFLEFCSFFVSASFGHKATKNKKNNEKNRGKLQFLSERKFSLFFRVFPVLFLLFIFSFLFSCFSFVFVVSFLLFMYFSLLFSIFSCGILVFMCFLILFICRFGVHLVHHLFHL